MALTDTNYGSYQFHPFTQKDLYDLLKLYEREIISKEDFLGYFPANIDGRSFLIKQADIPPLLSEEISHNEDPINSRFEILDL